MKLTKSLVAGAALYLASGAASAVVIDFDSTGIPTGTFTGAFTEDGFDLLFTDMMFAGTGSTSTAPIEIERRVLTQGTLEITKSGGGLFTFGSIDWEWEYGRDTSITIDGLVGGGVVGTDTYTATSGATGYSTYGAAGLAGISVDKLIIYADRDGASGGAFDTIVLEAAAAPEPGTVALLALGLAGLAARRRSRA